MILPSRNYPNPDAFVEDFLATVTTGVIPRFAFIDWDGIETRLKKLAPVVEYLAELQAKHLSSEQLLQEISDTLLSNDNPKVYVEGMFHMLGHTRKVFVTLEDNLKIGDVSRSIRMKNEEAAKAFTQIILDLGFENTLNRNDMEDVLFGVEIGLETHRRKNRGGYLFQSSS